MSADAAPPPEAKTTENAMSDEDFSRLFEDCIARRDYVLALKVCNQRLKAKPKDRYGLELRQTVECFIDATAELDEDGELAPPIEELVERAETACHRAFEAMFAHLTIGEGCEARLESIGEQAVGIFWDSGHAAAPETATRARLHEMSCVLIHKLMQQLKTRDRSAMNGNDWLFEGIGQAWWCYELDIPCEDWLLQGCREDWLRANGSMKVLVGYSVEELPDVPLDELCDLLTSTWSYERMAVNELLGGSLPALDYGVEQVFAEIGRRPLIEPPLTGSFDMLYILTHVVYVLNSFNGCLPNTRSDFPWLYAYLERSLAFWLREVNSSVSVPELTRQPEAVDVLAEIVDCLRGLGDDEVTESDNVREALVWLMSRQEEDGFFYAPGAKRPAPDTYDQIHPTWTAACALQLNRVPNANPSPRCARWAEHARAAAKAVGLATAPPPATIPTGSAS